MHTSTGNGRRSDGAAISSKAVVQMEGSIAVTTQEWEHIITIVVAFGGGAGLAQTIRVLMDWMRGSAADAREVRRDAAQVEIDNNRAMADFIDDLREQLLHERSRLDLSLARVDTLDQRVHAAMDYAHQLRQDIIAGRPPPPRDWPVGLG